MRKKKRKKLNKKMAKRILSFVFFKKNRVIVRARRATQRWGRPI
jgi:hypothetical protein